MFHFFKLFKNSQQINFGRFDLRTTERQKITKAILANSDNCGDFICGEPKLVKNIIRYGDKHNNNSNFKPYQYSTIPINMESGNPELCCQFYNFKKCNNCHIS